MSFINQAGVAGRVASQSFDDNNALISKQQEIGRLKEEKASEYNKHVAQVNAHKTANANLSKTNQTLLTQVEKVALENQKYKELLAKPLGEILQENANYKKAYEEQQELIAIWMLKQRSMKKVAMDLGKELNVSEEDIINKSMSQQLAVVENNDDLEGIIPNTDMQFFQKHKDYILKSLKD